MTKKELVYAISEKTQFTKKDIDTVVSAALESITEALVSGDKVSISGFGTFKVRTRGPRTGRNPATGKDVAIPASKTPTFKAGKGFKDAVQG